jgi:CHAD domain-containing protein
MAFAFRLDESIPKGVRRVVRKQFKDAVAQLNGSARKSVDERIHSVRKNFKRVRAVVRLVRYAIGDTAYHRENESFRDAARPLSEVRDAKVLIEALDKLEKLSRREDKAAPFGPVRKTLEKRQSQVRERITVEKNTFSDTANVIDKATKRLREWGHFSTGWKEIAKGIKFVYRSGRRAFDEVKANPSIENLHEWRKQAKYLRHQLELLAPSSPKVVGKLVAQAEKLADILGEDHDLAVLHSIVNDESKHSSCEVLCELIGHRRGKLQADAIPQGELLYRQRPGEFVGRLKSYWNESEMWAKGQRKGNMRAAAAG